MTIYLVTILQWYPESPCTSEIGVLAKNLDDAIESARGPNRDVLSCERVCEVDVVSDAARRLVEIADQPSA